MKSLRRRLLKTAGIGCAASHRLLELHWLLSSHAGSPKAEPDRLQDAPVLNTNLLKQPVTVSSIEWLKNVSYLVHTRSTERRGSHHGAQPGPDAGFLPRVLVLVPVFVKKDARQLESLL